MDNVIRIANEVGLEPVEQDVSGEIYLLLKPSFRTQQNYTNHFDKQRSAFLSSAKEHFFYDYSKIVKDIPKVLIKKILTSNF